MRIEAGAEAEAETGAEAEAETGAEAEAEAGAEAEAEASLEAIISVVDFVQLTNTTTTKNITLAQITVFIILLSIKKKLIVQIN